jgi:F-type H+-transporting ATPase subunit O
LIATRRFSTSPSAASLVKTPVPVYGTEGRYASALYSAASKNNALDAVEKDLATISGLLKTDPRLAEFLHDPSIKKSLKADGLGGVCDKLKTSELTKNLMLALGENNRFNMVPSVVNSFATLMSAHRGEVVCSVTTAKALDAAMSAEVTKTLGAFLKEGEKAQITFGVDPSIIGGMVISIGDKFVDMSMATKLTKYSEIIKSSA